jgi:hypothetical protein
MRRSEDGTDRRTARFLGRDVTNDGSEAVPIFFGFILGVVVTIAGAYAYDASTGRAGNGLSAAAASQAPMVNWDIVSNDWQDFKTNVRTTTEDIEQKFKQHS